jgi:hypothetical protein
MTLSKGFLEAPWIEWGVCEGGVTTLHMEELAACEVEIESNRHDSSSIARILRATPENRWDIVPEGSLRGGFELVSARPMPVSELLLSLSQITPAFDGVADTFRAAVHYHGNVQFFTREQYMKAIVAYYMLEPDFYKFAGEGRDESVFCVPWYKGNGHVHALTKAYYDCDDAAWRQAIIDSPKYSGLNLKATSRYGSLEFRHLPTPSLAPHLAVQRIAKYIDNCTRVLRTATDPRFTGTGMLEFADYVASLNNGVPVEHMCNVYSALAIERPIDTLAEGIASSTVRRTVETHATGIRLPSGRRRRRHASYAWANSTAYDELVALDLIDVEDRIALTQNRG